MVIAAHKHLPGFADIQQAVIFQVRGLYQEVTMLQTRLHVVIDGQVKSALHQVAEGTRLYVVVHGIGMYPYDKITYPQQAFHREVIQ